MNVFPPDGLVKKLEELEKVADMYQALIEHTGRLLKAFFDLSQSHKGMYCLKMLIYKSIYALLYGVGWSWCH